jgi:DNA-3-methyladenine glycosylase
MKLKKDFFLRDVLQVAPELVGKTIVHRLPDGSERRLRITETEAYRGEEDTACHARRGRTGRTQTLYLPGGTIYVYLCYGIHWLLNIVTGPADFPQAALIRACEGADGPGKLTKALGVDGRYNGSDITLDPGLWIEDDGNDVNIILDKRVGINYASAEDRERLWRFKKG